MQGWVREIYYLKCEANVERFTNKHLVWIMYQNLNSSGDCENRLLGSPVVGNIIIDNANGSPWGSTRMFTWSPHFPRATPEEGWSRVWLLMQTPHKETQLIQQESLFQGFTIDLTVPFLELGHGSRFLLPNAPTFPTHTCISYLHLGVMALITLATPLPPPINLSNFFSACASWKSCKIVIGCFMLSHSIISHSWNTDIISLRQTLKPKLPVDTTSSRPTWNFILALMNSNFYNMSTMNFKTRKPIGNIFYTSITCYI